MYIFLRFGLHFYLYNRLSVALKKCLLPIVYYGGEECVSYRRDKVSIAHSGPTSAGGVDRRAELINAPERISNAWKIEWLFN